ncbi:hypothetical protein PG993_007181 [Apiospora rasikravindrae]|uniref:Glycosyltransferase n=1 Tax=Apiospora rasikravindrae TaxID=990691 RepID=A0ABR1SWT0_9PEZI
MLVRPIPGRLVSMLTRYVAVILAALLVFYVVREPVNVAVSHLHGHRDAAAADGGATSNQANPPKVLPFVGPEQPGVPGAAAKPEGQTPMSDEIPPYKKLYKPEPQKFEAIQEPFPWLTHNNKMPPVLDNNLPPEPHVPEPTPLFIGFTRNWPMLLQCVSSYIAAGWPPADIYIVENTGTFRSNKEQELTLQNPFYMNHTQLDILGVHILQTPTLLSFAQLQNYFLHTALQRGWPHFFWSHQDVLVFSDEEVRKKDRDHDHEQDPYATLYERAVGLMRYLGGDDKPPWATHFFAYDHLTLVNRDAYIDVGAWDTHIPFYASDCDMYLRLHWAGYWQPQSEAGLIFDVSAPLDDVGALFRFPGIHATFAGGKTGLDPAHAMYEAEVERERDLAAWVDREGETFQHLVHIAQRMQEAKWADQGVFRNTWQARQRGGHEEPFYRDPDGFSAGLDTMIEAGRRVFADKWGHRGCDLLDLGVEAEDAWRLERDWDISEGPGSEGGSWGKDWMGGGD